MKWVYKECEVEITAIHDAVVKIRITPTVEINCPGAAAPHFLTTKELFKSEIEAQLHGVAMARDWIDENVN